MKKEVCKKVGLKVADCREVSLRPFLLPQIKATLSKQSQNEAPEDDHQLGFSSDMSSPADPVERQQQEQIGSSLDAVAEEAKTMAWENSGALTERSKSYALKLVCRAVSKCCCLLQEEAAHAKEIEKERNLLQFQTQLEKSADPAVNSDHLNPVTNSGCWGYLHKDYLKRHVQKCELGPLDAEKVMMDVMEESHRRKLESGFVVPEVKLKDKAFAQSVVGLALSHGHSVEENKAMSSDRLMMALAERLAQRSSSSDADSVADNLRRMLKALASLLIQLRHGVGQYDASLEDFLTTDRFDVLMCAVRAVSESFSEGSFLMSISYWIGWLVNLLLEEAEEQGDYEKLVRVRSFSIQLYYEWTDVYEELKGLCPEKRKMSKRGDQQRAKTEEKSGVTEVPAQSTEVGYPLMSS
nr:hypothetical protein BaRGS_015231 [Batillaria attramentaria]